MNPDPHLSLASGRTGERGSAPRLLGRSNIWDSSFPEVLKCFLSLFISDDLRLYFLLLRHSLRSYHNMIPEVLAKFWGFVGIFFWNLLDKGHEGNPADSWSVLASQTVSKLDDLNCECWRLLFDVWQIKCGFLWNGSLDRISISQGCCIFHITIFIIGAFADIDCHKYICQPVNLWVKILMLPSRSS